MSNSYDLNLYVVLDALLAERSVTGAARRLHLSIPATSRALSRLRKQLNDPVFVKAGRGLVPTDRALALQERVRHLVAEAHALAEDPACNPATLRRDFLVVASEAVLVSLAGPLLAHVETHAPHVRCAFLAEGPELAMRDSPVDLAIGASRAHEPEVNLEILMVDRLTGVCRPGHPLLRQGITPERWLAARHLGNSRRGRLSGPLDVDLGLPRSFVASAPIVTSLPILLATDMVGVCYETLERSIVQALGLATFDIPYDVQPIPIYQVWHPRQNADPAHAWLRETVRAVVAGLLPPSSSGDIQPANSGPSRRPELRLEQAGGAPR